MSFTERAGLISVLLLTGCAQPAVNTGPPSGSVVDGILSRSASDISAMQYRVHQTGPSAQRPTSPATKPDKPSIPGTISASALMVKPALATPASASGAGPVDGFVRQDGAAPTLRAALRKIIPPGQTVVFDKAISADAPELWRWTGNDRWHYVVDKMLAARGLKATVNEKARTVTVETVQRAQTAHTNTAVSPAVLPATSANSARVGEVKVTLPRMVGSNPFRGTNVSPSATALSGTPTKTVAQPQPTGRIWKIKPTTTLRQGYYEQWVSKEICPSDKPKWTIRWDTNIDYPIDDTVTVYATSFEDATAQLFALYRNARVPLYVNGYRPQCLIVISDVPPNTPPKSSP